MTNRFFTATSKFARRKASQSAAWAVFARDTISGFVTTAHHMLMVSGIIAIGALGVMFMKPDIADRLKTLSPFAAAEAATPSPQLAALFDAPAQSVTHPPVAAIIGPSALDANLGADDKDMIGSSRQQQWVTNWLSKRYRVANDATNMLVSAAYVTAKEIKLDPLLILSVMAIESGFNPFAESPVGAQGLMQVMSKVHHDKFEDHGGVKAALNPVANIKVGSLILKDYVRRGGSVEAGLKLYVGAGALESDSGYGAKVLAEYRRLKEVASGKKVPVYATSASSKPRQEHKAEPSESASADDDDTAAATRSDQLAAL
jgi:soluble lytic murein transglycosylase-like protein